MIIRRSRYSAASVGAQVDANDRVIFSKFWRKESPHQTCSWKAMDQQNRRALSITAHEDGVSCNFDLQGRERTLIRSAGARFLWILCLLFHHLFPFLVSERTTHLIGATPREKATHQAVRSAQEHVS